MSYVMPRRTRSWTISALFPSTNSRGGTPFLSASYVIGVPCSSVPLAINTREPRSRSKRASTSAGTAKPTTWPMCRGPLAYGHAGATRTVLRLSTCEHKGKLAARAVTESLEHIRCRAAQHLLVHLGQLARHREAALGQRLRDQRERLADAERRFERDRGPRVGAQRLQQPAHLARLAWQVTDEGETWSAVACDRESGGHRAGARDRHHGVAGRPRRGDQGLAWIREGRGAGVADQRHVALFQCGDHSRQPSALDRRVVAEHRLADAVSGKQARGHPCVFGGDRRHLTQDANGPCAQILEIADRGADHKKLAQSPSSQAPTCSATCVPGPT